MKTLWLHHESGCGGRAPDEEQFENLVHACPLVEQVSLRVYVHWYKTGDYDLEWVPPAWALDLFD